MAKEIERKFIAKTLPDISNYKCIEYERHFLFYNQTIEIRIQKKGTEYEFERKTKETSLKANKIKFKISKEEFETLSKYSKKAILRRSYLLSQNPQISLKVYQGEFTNLNRLEVEFSSLDEAEKFEVPKYFGKEITDSKLGKDSRLIQLSKEEFEKLLMQYKNEN